ncbi:MAG: hypothetical protein AB7U29_13525 [Desulfobulbus sp.]
MLRNFYFLRIHHRSLIASTRKTASGPFLLLLSLQCSVIHRLGSSFMTVSGRRSLQWQALALSEVFKLLIK